MNSDQTGPINIGNPKEISMSNLASKVIRLTQSKSKLIFMNLPQDDPKRRKAFRQKKVTPLFILKR